ncbi:prenyltransferase/squalene oxidase repeat-containing protein [Metasolibacillus meyeri]|uniref:prenyltransferase/squalene oxidase repeat-containing protein n=1 Tax=Metasolibacillus meyeri TaxID=1071052 RepID=UPI000D326708|nr:hypothetical protein [Metasolibacillus meyeri]
MKKINLKILLAIVLLITSIGIIMLIKGQKARVFIESKPYEVVSLENLPYETEVKKKYIRLKNKLLMPEGQISIQPYQHQFGTLYSTYFMVKSLLLLEYQFDESEKNDLKSFLFKDLEVLKNQSDNINQMNDLFYAMELIKMLKLKIDKDEIAVFEVILNELLLDNGAYRSNLEVEDDKGVLIYSTSQAIAILHHLNLEVSEHTKAWLVKAVQDWNIESEEFNAILNGYQALERIGMKKSIPKEMYDTFIRKLNKQDNWNLFDMNIYMGWSKYTGYQAPDLEKKLYNLLVQNQNEDLGWHVFFDENSEEQGILIAIEFLQYLDSEVNGKEGLRNTLLLQQGTNGGFSPLFKTVPSLENMFFVYHIDQLLNINDSKQKINMDSLPFDMTSANAFETYYFVALSKMVNSDIDVKNQKLIKEKINSEVIPRGDFRDLYFYFKTLNLLGNDLLKEFSLRELWNKQKKELTFEESLFLLNVLDLTNELTQEDTLLLIQSFKTEIDDAVEEPIVAYLLSNLLFNSEEFEMFFEQLKLSANNNLEKQVKENEPLSLIQLYYTLNIFANIQEVKAL